jgi:DNA primase
LPVVNPYADTLTFLDDRTRTRRDHDKYLTLIDTLALLHQHQRPIKSAPIQTGEGVRTIDYVEASLEDIAQANAGLYQLVEQRQNEQGGLRGDVRFTRLQVRAHMGLSDTQCRVHLDRLVALEHVLVHRGQRGQSYEYELLHDGPLVEGKAHLAGLIDVEHLQATMVNAEKGTAMIKSSRGQPTEFAGVSLPPSGDDAGPMRSEPTAASLEPLGLAASMIKKAPENASDNRAQEPIVPYLNAPLPVAVSSLAAGVGVSLAA